MGFLNQFNPNPHETSLQLLWRWTRPMAQLAAVLLCLGGAAVVLIALYHTLIVVIWQGWAVISIGLPMVTLALAIGVFALPNPVHNLLCLIGVFLSTTILFLSIRAEFLALVFLIVYVGAIAVLFLFVIMLLNVKGLAASQAPVDGIYGCNTEVLTGALVAKVYVDLGRSFWAHQLAEGPFAELTTRPPMDVFVDFVTFGFQDVMVFSTYLYSDFSALFVMVSLVLFIAMISAIALAADLNIDKQRQGPVKVETHLQMEDCVPPRPSLVNGQYIWPRTEPAEMRQAQQLWQSYQLSWLERPFSQPGASK